MLPFIPIPPENCLSIPDIRGTLSNQQRDAEKKVFNNFI